MEFKLILKKLNNTLSEKETTVFSEWYNESDSHKQYYANVEENYNKDSFLIDIEKGWEVVEKQIHPTAIKKNNYLKYSVAASVILMVSLTFLFNRSNIEKITNPIIVNNAIAIGTDKATLTLEDGSVVALEKGRSYKAGNINSNGEELVYNSKNNKGGKESNLLTIPRGGQFFVQLSDSTKVWLNSESQLKYPVAFVEGDTRQVELVYGEAYFEVSPSTKHNGAKFNVKTQEQNVEVIGTEFNIKAYKDEVNILTTLVKGKVALSTALKKEFLVPNQQSNLNLKNNTMDIATVDVYSEISWKKGLFVFKSMPMKEITKVLSRWYDVDITFNTVATGNVKFNGVLNKNQKLEDILTIIKKTNYINAYEIKNNTIIIK